MRCSDATLRVSTPPDLAYFALFLQDRDKNFREPDEFREVESRIAK